jgi:hypothetical protein
VFDVLTVLATCALPLTVDALVGLVCALPCMSTS